MAVILAAGGLVRDADGNVVVVHRPKYDDWTLPKGKLDGGETFEQAAVREVEEETGLRCELVEPIGEVIYPDPKGRPKRVRYWLMRPVEGDIRNRRPDAEIDEVRWVDVDGAERLLSYEFDRRLLRSG